MLVTLYRIGNLFPLIVRVLNATNVTKMDSILPSFYVNACLHSRFLVKENCLPLQYPIPYEALEN